MKLKSEDILKPNHDITARTLDPSDPLVDWDRNTEFIMSCGILIPQGKFKDPDIPVFPTTTTLCPICLTPGDALHVLFPDIHDSSPPIDGIIPK